VEIPVSLEQLLSRLNLDLDDSEIDLTEILDDLVRALLTTVDSFLGLTITMTVTGFPITVSSMSDDVLSLSSLRLPLPGLRTSDPGSIVYLFAARLGAFVDLAADLAVALGLEGAALQLDFHTDRTGSVPAGTDLSVATAINQAVGIMIERGYTVEDALTRLQSMAAGQRLTLNAVALEMVAATRDPRVAEEL
jgi:hypothetical protein